MTPIEKSQIAKENYNKIEKEKNETLKSVLQINVQPLFDLANQKKIESELYVFELFKEELEEAKQEVIKAKKELDEYNLERSKKEDKGHKEGTKLYEWVMPSFQRRYILSGRIGEVVIYDGTQDIKQNKYEFDRPTIGTKIIIVLKKDGTKGKKFYTLNDYKAQFWLLKNEVKR